MKTEKPCTFSERLCAWLFKNDQKMENANKPSLKGKPKYTREQTEAVDFLISEVIESRIWEETISPEEITQTPTANAKGSGEAIHARCSSGRVKGIQELLNKSCGSEAGCKIVIPAFSITVDHDENGAEFYTIELICTGERSISNN
jgi:hypothetical protein